MMTLFEKQKKWRPNLVRLAAMLATGLLAGACVSTNKPLNAFSGTLAAQIDPLIAEVEADSASLVGLAFSGGGTRAAAFSYGVLHQLRETALPGSNGKNLFDTVRYLSGVSGGSVTAAYFGLKGENAFTDYEQAFLYQDAEEYLRTSALRPTNLLRAASGGVNDRQGFGLWIDENLFKGAKFSQLRSNSKITTWISAADIYNRLPFTFEPETFRALCSDLDKLPIAEAVAASAAVPIVFSPIVIEAFGPRCAYQPPAWLTTATYNTEATASLRAYSTALQNYRDPEKMRFVKLLDGGITDNFGLTSLSIERARSQTPYGPLTQRQAVMLDRMMFMVVNSGIGNNASWANEIRGPSGFDLVMAVTDTATVSAMREGFDSFRLGMGRWQQDLIDYRCSLTTAEIRRFGRNPEKFNCKSLKLFIGELRFDQLDEKTFAALEKIPTRLKLSKDEVALTISAGKKVAANDPTIRSFLAHLIGLSGDSATPNDGDPAPPRRFIEPSE